MVEYRDGSTLAQLGPSDMRVPIAATLAWPERMDTPLRAARPRRDRRADLLRAGRGAFPGHPAGPQCRRSRRRGARGAQCGERSGGCRVPRRSDRVHRNFGKGGQDALARYPRAPATLDEVLAVDAETRARAREMLELA